MNTWALIFLIAASQGLFLSVLLLLKNEKANKILGTLILTFTLCLFYYIAYWTGFVAQLPKISAILLGTTYLLGPILYFYFQSFEKSQIAYWKHLLPFGLFVVYFFTVGAISGPLNARISFIQVLAQNLHLIVYSILFFQLAVQKKKTGKRTSLFQWHFQITWAFAGYTLSFLIYYVMVWTSLLQIEYDYMISLASSFFIYFVGYRGFSHPEVLKTADEKYKRSPLTTSAAQSILKALKNYLTDKKPYLNSDLKLEDISLGMDIPKHHLSQAINELEQKSFPEFINEYRLAEARQLLSDPGKTEMRIIDIAYTSGFNNKVSFNNSFKKVLGMSPSQFREKHAEALLD